MFAGVGGFDLGLQRQGHKCVGYSEIDKYATYVYRYNFGTEVMNYGNATNINPDELPDFDLLCGGFPCQAFSVAGKRKGFEDTRGTLFFEIARIARAKRLRYLFLENVKGLLNHDQGKTFGVILQTLDELGYDVQWQVLNSKFHGVPQNRERVFIIASLRGRSPPEIFPFGSASGIPDQRNSEEQTANALQHPGHSGGNYRGMNMIVQLNQPTHSNDRVYSPHGLSPTLNTMQGGNRQPFVMACLTPDRLEKRQNGRRFKNPEEPMFTVNTQDRHGVMFIPEATRKGYAVAKPGDSINLSCLSSKTRRGRVGKQIAQTIDTGMQQYTMQGISIRRLTPLECERLQGFPDNWTQYGIDDSGKTVEISDTQRYRQMGNAVTVNVIEAIARLI